MGTESEISVALCSPCSSYSSVKFFSFILLAKLFSSGNFFRKLVVGRAVYDKFSRKEITSRVLQLVSLTCAWDFVLWEECNENVRNGDSAPPMNLHAIPTATQCYSLRVGSRGPTESERRRVSLGRDEGSERHTSNSRHTCRGTYPISTRLDLFRVYLHPTYAREQLHACSRACISGHSVGISRMTRDFPTLPRRWLLVRQLVIKGYALGRPREASEILMWDLAK